MAGIFGEFARSTRRSRATVQSGVQSCRELGF
jgi:hypothetical protein